MKLTESSFRRTNEESRLIILNAQGSLMVDKHVGESIESILVTDSVGGKSTPSILCISDKDVFRFSFGN